MSRLFARRNRRGQIIPIFAISAPFWLALLGLLIAGEFLVTQKLGLDSATESAALAGASQISVSAYESSNGSTIVLESFTQPDVTPCDQTNPSAYNRLLCSVQTALCDSYNHSPTQSSDCISNNGGSTCASPSPGTMVVSVCDVFTGTASNPCSSTSYPAQANEIDYCVFSSNSSQVLNVVTWYTYPNPIGGFVVSQLHATSDQLAEADVTPCTNGTNVC